MFNERFAQISLWSFIHFRCLTSSIFSHDFHVNCVSSRAWRALSHMLQHRINAFTTAKRQCFIPRLRIKWLYKVGQGMRKESHFINPKLFRFHAVVGWHCLVQPDPTFPCPLSFWRRTLGDLLRGSSMDDAGLLRVNGKDSRRRANTEMWYWALFWGLLINALFWGVLINALHT